MARKRDRKMHQTADTATTTNLTERLRSLRDLLLTGLVERDVAIRLALLATLAGEHLLLIGPPGTAKSLLARRLQLAFKDSTYFERLLTRFTVPEELFGPLSIKALENDRYERLTAKYLPTASVAFLDEIFKANSAILNALLTLLNEREFDNGTQRERTPLLAAIGASNELPEGDELAALFDRFLLRLHVGPVTSEGFGALLGLRGNAIPVIPQELKLSAADLDQVRVRADAVDVPEDVVAMLADLRKFCVAEELPVSDRRWRKIVKLLQVSALTNGRDAVSIWDCWLLQHCLWDAPEEREAVYGWYAARVGASAAMDPGRLTKVVVSWEGQLKKDQDSRSQQMNEQGRLLYQSDAGNAVVSPRGPVQMRRDGEPLFVAQHGWLDRNGHGLDQAGLDNSGNGYTAAELGRLHLVAKDQWGDTTRIRVSSWSDRAAYQEARANWFTVTEDLPPVIGPTQHRRVYVDSCLREIDHLAGEVDAYRAKLEAHIQSLAEQVRVHLWVTPDFADPAASALDETRRVVEGLRQRVTNLRKGFELLPREVEV